MNYDYLHPKWFSCHRKHDLGLAGSHGSILLPFARGQNYRLREMWRRLIVPRIYFV